MLEKKILVYSHISNNICSFIFSFLSLFPGGAFFSLDEEGRAKSYYNCYSPYGLPLKFLNKNSVLYSILTLYDIDKIEEKNIISYFVGTTNPLLMNYNKIEFDCIINLDDDKITFNKKINSNLLHLGKKESFIMDKLKKECKSLFTDDNMEDMDDNWMLDKDESKINKRNVKKSKREKVERKSVYLQNNNDNFSVFEGSDDYIRNLFIKYITNFLSDIQLSQHISKVENLDNEKKLSKIKDVLNDYNCNFIYNWITKTQNFLFWNYEHGDKLWCLSPHLKKCKNVKKFYENGDIYEGEVSFGEPNKKGKLDFTIKEIPYTYVGEFSNGIKEGNGNLFSKDNLFNYDGEWKNDKYDGFGALYDHGEKYTGDFKEGKFHGTGNLYKVNGDIYEGEFFEGNIKKGKITYKNGDIFKGKFEDGKKKFGLIEYIDGNKYEGYFENDLYNGEGILISKDGKEEKGIFKDGILEQKLDKLKFEIEKEQEILGDGINIEIKQSDDWEIAEIISNKNKEENNNKEENKEEDKKEENKNDEKNNEENYIKNIMENNINMTTDSLDVVSFTNISITNDNIPKEDIEEEKK